MKFSRFLSAKAAAAAGVALVALGGASVAQARDNVYWSLGVDAAPGVSIGVGNVRPVYVAPQPVYVAPQPVYVRPQPVYVAPPQVVYHGGYVQAAPVYVQPRPVYQAGYYYDEPHGRGHWKNKHKHKHHRHHD